MFRFLRVRGLRFIGRSQYLRDSMAVEAIFVGPTLFSAFEKRVLIRLVSVDFDEHKHKFCDVLFQVN